MSHFPSIPLFRPFPAASRRALLLALLLGSVALPATTLFAAEDGENAENVRRSFPDGTGGRTAVAEGEAGENDDSTILSEDGGDGGDGGEVKITVTSDFQFNQNFTVEGRSQGGDGGDAGGESGGDGGDGGNAKGVDVRIEVPGSGPVIGFGETDVDVDNALLVFSLGGDGGDGSGANGHGGDGGDSRPVILRMIGDSVGRGTRFRWRGSSAAVGVSSWGGDGGDGGELLINGGEGGDGGDSSSVLVLGTFDIRPLGGLLETGIEASSLGGDGGGAEEGEAGGDGGDALSVKVDLREGTFIEAINPLDASSLGGDGSRGGNDGGDGGDGGDAGQIEVTNRGQLKGSENEAASALFA